MRDLGHYFQVDEEKLRNLIQFQLEHHVHGLVVLGGTGEYTALSTEERVRAISIALDAVQGKLPVIAGVLETGFGEFLENTSDEDLKAEYLLPTIIGSLLKEGELSVKVLKSHDFRTFSGPSDWI